MCVRCFLVVICVLYSLSGVAQIDYKKNSTEKIEREPDLIPKNEKQPRRLLSIYTNDTKSILYGNPCMDEVTARFGYEYVVMPKNAQGFSSGINKALHNFGVKFILFFRNPFWKVIVNKKAKECRQKTGDYMG